MNKWIIRICLVCLGLVACLFIAMATLPNKQTAEIEKTRAEMKLARADIYNTMCCETEAIKHVYLMHLKQIKLEHRSQLVGAHMYTPVLQPLDSGTPVRIVRTIDVIEETIQVENPGARAEELASLRQETPIPHLISVWNSIKEMDTIIKNYGTDTTLYSKTVFVAKRQRAEIDLNKCQYHIEVMTMVPNPI